jgi:hypothetical protein
MAIAHMEFGKNLSVLTITSNVGLSAVALCYKPKVAGSSPDEVDFFGCPNPSSSTMALGST